MKTPLPVYMITGESNITAYLIDGVEICENPAWYRSTDKRMKVLPVYVISTVFLYNVYKQTLP